MQPASDFLRLRVYALQTELGHPPHIYERNLFDVRVNMGFFNRLIH